MRKECGTKEKVLFLEVAGPHGCGGEVSGGKVEVDSSAYQRRCHADRRRQSDQGMQDRPMRRRAEVQWAWPNQRVEMEAPKMLLAQLACAGAVRMGLLFSRRARLLSMARWSFDHTLCDLRIFHEDFRLAQEVATYQASGCERSRRTAIRPEVGFQTSTLPLLFLAIKTVRFTGQSVLSPYYKCCRWPEYF